MDQEQTLATKQARIRNNQPVNGLSKTSKDAQILGMPKPKIHMLVRDILRDRMICKDITTENLNELCYEFMLFDRDKYMGFQDQAMQLLKGRPGFSLIEIYPVYNTFHKFGEAIQERYEFEVTLKYLE